MSKRCPFVVLTECFEDKCAVWRVSTDGVGYCGAGGPPPEAYESHPKIDLKITPEMFSGTIVDKIQKQTTNGAQVARQTRRSRS